MKEFFGENPKDSEALGRIINEGHFDRLSTYLEHGDVIVGGSVSFNSAF